VTHRRSYLRETIKGTGKAAYKTAEDKLAEFRTQVAKQQSTTSTRPVRPCHRRVDEDHRNEARIETSRASQLAMRIGSVRQQRRVQALATDKH
jgi:hypothetical protein